MYLYIWEHPNDRTNANWTTRVATHHLSLAAAIILIAAFAGIVPPAFPALASKLVLPVALSTLADRGKRKVRRQHPAAS